MAIKEINAIKFYNSFFSILYKFLCVYFRVLHTKGLRVADASIMPEMVVGNTNCPTVLVGEKGADMVREYWSRQYLVCPKSQILFRCASSKCFYSRLT